MAIFYLCYHFVKMARHQGVLGSNGFGLDYGINVSSLNHTCHFDDVQIALTPKSDSLILPPDLG